MRLSRKLALGLGAVVVLLLVAVAALPFLFKDRITSRLRAELDESVTARLAWSGIGLSVLRDFPNVSLTVDRLSAVNGAPFAGDTLIAMRKARLVLDLSSVIGYLRNGDPIVVREVALEQPKIRLRVLPDGRANWDIVRERKSAAGGAARPVRVTLRELTVNDASLTLDDQQSRLAMTVTGLDESLRGDFAQDRFTLATRTNADTVSLRFAGVPYLNRVALAIDADVDADLGTKRFTIADASLKLNRLDLAITGSVTAGTPDVGLDLRFATPSTAFRDIISLVPALYARNFEQLETTGSMSVAGQVRGSYGPKAFPALAVRASVKDGAFRHAGLPLPARDITMELAIDNPGGHVDSTTVNLKQFHASLGGRPLDARFVMRTPVSDPDVDLRVKGSINLADLARTVKLEGVNRLSGVVAADVGMRARLSDVDARRYERVDARGTMHAGRIALRSTTLPHDVAVDTVALRLTPRTAEMTAFAARVGNSDLRATGALDNLLGFALRGDDLRGTATINSNHLDLNEWRSDEALTVVPVPARIDFAVNAAATRVTFDKLMISNVRGGVRIRDQRATLSDLRMEMLRGSVIADGFYETVIPDRPAFDIDLRVATVDIPDAFAALTTVQQLAPIARWAQGQVSGAMTLKGTLLQDMSPHLSTLTGKGDIETDRLAIQDAPVLGRLADALQLDQLRNPALGALRMSYDIANGRVQVKPFKASVGGIDMTVAGSNGIDRSLLYDLAVAVPRASLGAGITRLAARARQAGAELSAGDIVQLGAKVTGTVADPAVRADFAGTAASVRDAAQSVAQAGVQAGTDAVKARADSAADDGRRRAREEADRLVAEAERQADGIRAEARAVAERMRREAGERSDSLVARATNPAARLAAQAAADRLRRETDQQAERIVREADARAGGIVAEAQRRAEAIAPSEP